MEMMAGLAVFGDTIAQCPETRQAGEGQQEDQHWPEVVPGQSLGQNVKYDRHLMNLLYEDLLLASLTTIIDLPQASSQGDSSRSRCPPSVRREHDDTQKSSPRLRMSAAGNRQ
jgi:hypothetical protein